MVIYDHHVWGVCRHIFRVLASIRSLRHSASYQIRRALNGFAYYTNFGSGLVVAIFAWIVTTSFLVALTIRLSPKRLKATLYLSTQSDFIGKTPRIFGLDKIWANASGFSSAESYINAVSTRILMWTGRVILFLTAMPLYLSWCETTWHEVYTEDGYIEFSFWTNATTKSPWSQAASVELGCNQTDDGSSLIYEIRWSEGEKTRFLNYDDDFLPETNWLDGLEIVNARISNTDAKFKRWEWLSRDPLHPNCLSFFERRMSKDEFSRFKAILRIDTLDVTDLTL